MKIADSERLLLREAQLSDAPFFIELMNSEGWVRHIGDRKIRTIEDAEHYIKNSLLKSYAENKFGLYLIEIKPNSSPIGICGLVKRDTSKLPDLGFALLPEYEGKGYMQEASLAILERLRTEQSYPEILAITGKSNIRSQNLLERLGFVIVPKEENNGEEYSTLTYLFSSQKV